MSKNISESVIWCDSMSKQEFINLIKPGAIDGYIKYGILPSLIIAQAILESNWGKSHISYNLFGIKAGTGWQGKIAIKKTKEFVNGVWITVEAKFRAYDSFSESIIDHAKLLGTSSRYKKVTQAADYITACYEVWKAGYATDPNYPKKLIAIIEQGKLYEYDKQKDNLQDNKTKVLLHGREVEAGGSLKDGVYSIPIRFLEQLGYRVGWQDGVINIDYR